MRLPSWRQIVAQLSTWKTGLSSAPRERRDFARLSLRRLEDRRVLNGAPVGMGVTISDAQGAVIVDASHADGTGHSFDMSLNTNAGKIDLELTDHGTILYEEEINNIASVTFLAAANNQALTIDFANGDPIPSGGISFIVAGGGQQSPTDQQGLPGDSLQLVNGAAGSVAYSLSNSGSGQANGQVDIGFGSQHSSIVFSGMTQVSDELSAATRSFSIGGTDSQIQLSAPGLASGLSQLSLSQLGLAAGTAIDFSNPAQALSVNGDAQGNTVIDVHGLDSNFNANLNIAAGAGSTVDFSAPLNLGAGSLSVSGGNINVNAPIATSGGTIELSATEQIIIAPTGGLSTTAAAVSLAAPQITQQGFITDSDGGNVSLDAGVDGTLIDSGLIDASSTVAGHTGGSVELLGKYVGLTGAAVVNVSGAAGGGSALIGGGYHGANSAIQNAVGTYVGQGVTIAASAITSGGGGQVIVWSTEVTRFYGQVDARGGALGGAGGFAEISSAQALDAHGQYNLSATQGRAGTLLFDPLAIEIKEGTGNGSDGDGNSSSLNPGTPGQVNFANATSPFIVYQSEIENTNANIILQAANTITVDDMSANGGTGVLLVSSGNNIVLETRNDTTQGDSATGGITFLNTANTLQTQGSGTITIAAGVNADTLGNFTSSQVQGTADVTVGGLHTDTAGAIAVTASRNITVDGAVVSSGAAARFNADSTAAKSGTFALTLTGSVTTDLGAVHGALKITAADVSLPGTLTGGTITFQTNAVETMGLGSQVAGLQITNGALSRITADSLVVGGANASSVYANGVGLANVANIAAVTMQALTSQGSVGFVGNASEFNTLTLNAVHDAGANANLTTHGVLTINADAGALGTGTIDVAPGVSIDTSNHLLNITASDTDFVGTISSGTATTTIRTAVNESFQLGNFDSVPHVGIGRHGMSHITAGTLIVGDALMTGIAVDGIQPSDVAHIGTMVLQAGAAGADISFLGNDSTFQALSATAQNQIAFAAGQTLTTTNGGISLTGTTAGITDTGDLTLSSQNGVSLGSSLTTNTSSSGAGLAINADTGAAGVGTFSLAAGSTLATNGNALNLTAAAMTLTGAGTDFNSGVGTTTIKASHSETVGLGAAGNLAIDATVLANSTFGALVIGGTTTGSITVKGVTLSGASQGPVTLDAQGAGASLLFTGGVSAFNAVTGNATTDITVDAPISATPKDVFLKSLGTMTITANGAIDTSPGSGGTLTVNGGFAINGAITVGAGNITLIALGAGSDLTINGNLTNTSSINLSAPRDIIIEKAVKTTSLTADISLTADVNGTGSGGVWITSTGSLNSGRNVTISGSSIFTAHTYPYTNPAATTGASIEIDANSGSPAADQVVAVGNIKLISSAAAPTGSDVIVAGVVRSSGPGNVDITAQHDVQTATTIASAGGNITLNSPVILDAATTVNSGGGNITLSGAIDSAAGGTSDLTLTAGTTAGAVTMSGAVGAGQSLGNLTVTNSGSFLASQSIKALSVGVNSANGVTLNGNVTATGTVTVNADSDANNSGTLTIANGIAVNTNNNALSLTAANMTLGATTTLASGTASTTIQASDNETIGLGAGAGQIQLTNTILENITSSSLLVGGATGATTGTITSDGASTSAQQGPVTLKAGAAGALVVFSGGTSAFAALDVTANDRIQIGTTVNANKPSGGAITFETQTFLTGTSALTSLGGNITFSSTVDSQTATAEGLTVTAGAGNVTFTGAVGSANPLGALSVVSSQNFLESAGVQALSVSINATNNVTFTGSVATTGAATGAGTVTVVADSDGSGQGTFTESAGVNALSSNSAVSIKADQVSLTGAIQSGTAITTIEGSAGETIGLGIGAGHIQLTNGVLGLIHSGALVIGGSTTGTITADTATTGSQQGAVTFKAGSSNPGSDVVFSGGTSAFAALDVTANDRIQIGTTVNANKPSGGAITFETQTFLTGTSALTSLGGNITFSSTVDSQTATAEGLTVTAGAGNVTFTGAVGSANPLGALSVVSSQNFLESAGVQALSVSINATNNVTFTGSVATTANGAGTVSVNADSDANGVGAFGMASSVTVNSDNSTLNIMAATMNLSGSVTLNSGTAATTIQASHNETIGLNDPSEDITIDAAALSNIHSGALVLGGTTTGSIVVGAVTSAQSAQVGPVTLIADAALANITFAGAATFGSAASPAGTNAIKATAAHNIEINAAIVTSPGDVYLDAGNNLTIKVNPSGGSIATAGSGGGTLTVNGGISLHDITVGAGNVTLIARGTGADLTVGDLTIGASINLLAPRDIIVTGIITTTGVLSNVSLTADSGSPATGVGGVWIQSTGSISATGYVTVSGSNLYNNNTPLPLLYGHPAGTTGTSILIDASSVGNDPIVASGSVTLKSSAAAPAGSDIIVDGIVRSSAAGAMDITAQHDIQLATTLGSAGGTMTFHSPVILNTATSVSSGGGDVTFNGSATVDSAAGTHNGLTITAGSGNVLLSSAVGAGQSLGAFSIASSKTFTESSGVTSQTVAVKATDSVTLNGNMTTTANGAGTVAINADSDSSGTGTFTVGLSATVNSDNSPLTITAADVTISGFLNSGSNTTTIQTAQPESIFLGNTAAPTGNMTIDGTELSHITANALVLGSATTTGMTVDGITSLESQTIGTIFLDALANGASINFLNNSSTFQSLVATAQDNIVFGPGLTVTAAAASTGSLTLTAQSGAMNDTGALNLNAVDGVTLNSNLTTGGALSINADTDNDGAGTLTVASGVQVVTTNSSNLTAIFGVLNLLGTLNSTGATTTLAPTNLQTIGVGLATGQFTVDSTLLAKITAQNLTIGGTLNGNITVDGFVPSDAPHIPGTVTLLAKSANAGISFVNHASTFDDLSASSDNGIQVQQNLTTVGAAGVAGNLVLNGDADNGAVAGAAANNIVFSPNVVLTAGGPAGLGGITLSAQTGGMTDTGALTLDAENGVTINSNLTTGTAGSGAPLTISADTDANLTGTLTVGAGAAVDTTNNTLNSTSADISLVGTISAGTAPINLHTSISTETIGIGDGSGPAQNFSLSNAEVGNIINTTGVVTIGDLTNTGDVHVAANESINAHSLNVTLQTGTNIRLDEADKGFGFETTGNVTLTADGDNTGTGAIIGGKGILGANLLTLSAAQGIGNNQNGPGLNTAAATLDAVNTTSGIIAINQSADSNIGHATGDLIVNRLWEEVAGPFISLSTTGQLIEGTSPSGQNIVATSLELIAATGIGSSGLLQTNVSTLALVNSTSGNVQINNITGVTSGALAIGTVGSSSVATTVGVQNTGGGFINLINAGPLTINNNVANSGGGDTFLTTVPGAGNDLTINALVDATHGGGSLYLNAGNNLLINDSGNGPSNTPDVETQGTGQIVAIAQNQVVLANNVLIQADQGGNIAFSALASDLTSNARIYATGGGGNILLFAGHNINVNDSGFNTEMSAQGSGKILGYASNAVNYAPNVSFETAQAWSANPGPGILTTHPGGPQNVSMLSPDVYNVSATEVKVSGEASVTLSFGNLGTQNYQINVDWHDGTVDTYYSTNPAINGSSGIVTGSHIQDGQFQQLSATIANGTVTFVHFYTSFPNTVDQSAPIPISLSVVADPNIYLIGAQQTPIVSTIDRSGVIPGQIDVRALGNGFQGTQNQNVVPLALIAMEDLLNSTLLLAVARYTASPSASPFAASAPAPSVAPSIAPDALTQLVAFENSFINVLNPGGFPFTSPVEPEFTGPQTSEFLTFAQVPGNGLGLITIDSNIYITTFHLSPPTTAAIIPAGAVAPSSQTQSETLVAQQTETANAEERVVVIEALDADGKLLLDSNGKPMLEKLNDNVLDKDNLDEFFKGLPDGRYRISVIEPGETRPRILLDINLRGHKQSNEAEEDEGKPPASDEGASSAERGSPQAALPIRVLREDSSLPLSSSLGLPHQHPLVAASSSDFPAAAVIAVAPVDTNTTQANSAAPQKGEMGRHESELPAGAQSASRHGLARSAAETALGLGALSACIGARNWEERVDAALAEAGTGTLSKSARLARRLTRPPEHTPRRATRRFGNR